jgi:hypothetical protein
MHLMDVNKRFGAEHIQLVTSSPTAQCNFWHQQFLDIRQNTVFCKMANGSSRRTAAAAAALVARPASSSPLALPAWQSACSSE